MTCFIFLLMMLTSVNNQDNICAIVTNRQTKHACSIKWHQSCTERKSNDFSKRNKIFEAAEIGLFLRIQVGKSRKYTWELWVMMLYTHKEHQNVLYCNVGGIFLFSILSWYTMALCFSNTSMQEADGKVDQKQKERARWSWQEGTMRGNQQFICMLSYVCPIIVEQCWYSALTYYFLY